MFTMHYIRIILLIFVALSVSGHYHNPQTNRCFQCEHRPPKIHTVYIPIEEEFEYRVPVVKQACPPEEQTQHRQQYRYRYGPPGNQFPGPYGYRPAPSYAYQKKCIPKVEYEIRKGYRLKYERRTHSSPAGGYNPCMGPLMADSARSTGVNDHGCENACYTRTDSYGNIARGCYKGEFGINPEKTGPQKVNGETYWLCKGSYCNDDKV